MSRFARTDSWAGITGACHRGKSSLSAARDGVRASQSGAGQERFFEVFDVFAGVSGGDQFADSVAHVFDVCLLLQEAVAVLLR